MPGDTLVIEHAADSMALRDSLNRLQLAHITPVSLPDDDTIFLICIGILICLVAIPFSINWLLHQYRQDRAFKAAAASLLANFVQYDAALEQFNGYYRRLSPDLRKRFLERVARFTATKKFTCMDLPFNEQMPLLIGAAAVQISFGLDKYQLDFFDTIYILQDHYNYSGYEKPFEGHVNREGIYLSWNNFLKGFEDYTDADNVGIHEMAHALAFVNFMAGDNDAQDDAFIQRFHQFSLVARPIYENMQFGVQNMLNSYAATNYNEFWAVAVETFFEKSLEMKLNMPELYTAMCDLLNQDPLTIINN